jgi:hypothetical protein
MSDQLRARAEARLDEALEAAPVRDPRPYLRRVLKYLKERDPAAFERAIAHYESALIPAVAGDGDALGEWQEFGMVLARLTGDGRVVAIDGTGRAAPAAGSAGQGDPEPGGDALLLYLPEAEDRPPVVLRCPREATAAQEASIDLLVLGRVSVEP